VTSTDSAQARLDGLRARIENGFAEVGHPILAPVTVAIRSDLPPAATTFRNGAGFVVLVSDRAVESGNLELLLAHELGHVQRMASGHASHDDDAIAAAYESVDGKLEREYQRSILHHAINYTHDLYADPVSLRVARRLGLVEPGVIDALIVGFANDEPYDVADELERRWDRTEDMVGNARALALARLANAPRARETVARMQRRYLDQIPADVASEAAWFESFLGDLPEETTRDDFTRSLVEYTRRFVATANGRGR